MSIANLLKVADALDKIAATKKKPHDSLLGKMWDFGFEAAKHNKSRAPVQSREFMDLYKKNEDRNFVDLAEAFANGYQAHCDEEAAKVLSASSATKWKPLHDFGCFVRVEDNTIFTVPMLVNGEKDDSDESEVTEPESQKFLDAVNKLFSTSFKMSQF